LDRAKATLGDHDTLGDIFSKQLFAVGSLGSLFESIKQKSSHYDAAFLIV
jgi:hypothetical protein